MGMGSPGGPRLRRTGKPYAALTVLERARKPLTEEDVWDRATAAGAEGRHFGKELKRLEVRGFVRYAGALNRPGRGRPALLWEITAAGRERLHALREEG